MKFKDMLGISLYPNKCTLEKIEEYLKLSKKYSFNLVFINLIDVLESDDKNIIDHFKKTIQLCKKYDFQITVDVNKGTFDFLKIDWKNPNLKFFNELGIDVLRLDDQFNGIFESTLTFNEYGIKIELNPSTFNESIQNIISYGANTQNLQALHNFYPQRYSGLSYDKFKEFNNKVKKQGLKIGAFITISDHASEGPWDVSENLPTLEIHRDMNIGLQLNHLLSNNDASYFYISTQFANENDFKEIYKYLEFKKCIKVNFEKEITKAEKEIVNYTNHFVRGDLSEYIFRSTESRKIFKDSDIAPRVYSEKIIPAGAIVIPNNNYKKYKSELQIVYKDIKNDGTRNVIGFIEKDYEFILNEIKPWTHFKLV